MNADFIPILVVPAVPHKGGIRFLHRDHQIDIEPDSTYEFWRVLSCANGYNSLSDIADLTHLSTSEVMEIISELCKMELVVDSREQFMHFHRISNYPTAFTSNLTQDEIEAYTKTSRAPVKSGKVFEFKADEASALFPIRENRRSCRHFSGKRLTLSQIGNICHYAYAISKHSVPSGGALYPLKLFVILEGSRDGLPSGYYEYDAEADNLVLFNEEIDLEQLKYCFNQETTPFGSSTQIIIAADLDRQAYKYANRGYRLTLIEVGHVAENISLYCAEQGLGACEMGGLLDESLKHELNLPDNIWPILAIPVGYTADLNNEPFDKIRFVEENTGDRHPVKGVFAKTFGQDGAFFGATATYRDDSGNIQYAGATSPSYADAVFKATVEGYERWLSGQVRADFYGSANQILENWLDPRKIAPLTPEQAVKSGVKPFTEDLPINWTKGYDCNDADVYVPSDLVYYGQKDDEDRIYFGNSSGVAAHFKFEEAKKRALLELIERDALMTNWYKQSSPRIVSEQVLPIHVKNRIAHWAEQNRELRVLLVPSNFGLVFETVIFSDDYPCFVSGASATFDKYDIPEAILKSTREAEYNLILALNFPDSTPIDPTKVTIPAEHGKVYHFKENVDKLRWLLDGNRVENFEQSYRDVPDLITVELSNEESRLRVVRVFSPHLVPINFGFNTAHYKHPAIEDQAHPDSLKMPHYFA